MKMTRKKSAILIPLTTEHILPLRKNKGFMLAVFTMKARVREEGPLLPQWNRLRRNGRLS